ncbi:hypothetical protein Pan110_53660 [Gimesia panareensis]|nr:hypothetical protein Pan110_53660 [Gimesia panareensis]
MNNKYFCFPPLIIIIALCSVLYFKSASATSQITLTTFQSHKISESIKLRNLIHVNDPSQLPHRNIISTWPSIPEYLGKPAIFENTNYLVGPEDVISIFLTNDVNEIPFTEDSPKMSLYYESENISLINQLRNPRFPCSLLNGKLLSGEKVNHIIFRITTPEDLKYSLPLSGILVPGATWGDIRSRLESISFRLSSGKKWRVRATLIPSSPEKARPGDKIIVHRLIGDDHHHREQRVDSFTLTVSPDGYIWLPPLWNGMSHPTGNFPIRQQPNSRYLNASIDRSYFHIKVFFPHISSNNRLSLSEISDILSSLSMVQTGSAFKRPTSWNLLGINEQFLSDHSSTAGVRYSLRLADSRTWMLVNEKGAHKVFGLHGRKLLVESLLNSYREMTGRELLESPHNKNSVAYLTVLPSSFSSHENSQAPFYGRIDSGDLYSELKYISLLPGDTVFVSRTPPQVSFDSLP